MARTLVLIAGVAAAALLAESAALAARQDVASSDSVDLLPPAPSHAPKPPAFHGLLGVSETEVTARLGQPDLARAEGKGGMWTYRLPDCALFVFFRGSASEGLKVSGAASGPRTRGHAPPPVNECLTEAMNRHAAGAPRLPR
jgi:hypothetical protein